jgi:hypothetical protein
MGGTQSNFFTRKTVNYDCVVCKLSGQTPNILGKFVVINDKEYKCNSCDSVFKKEYCSECRKPHKIPNLAGSFFVIKNDSECSCKVE